MKKRWIGFSISTAILIIISIFDGFFLLLRNSNYESVEFKQYLNCRENFCNSLNYPSEYASMDLKDPVKRVYCELHYIENPESLKQSCGAMPIGKTEYVYDFIHKIWKFIFDNPLYMIIRFPIFPVLILLMGYGIGFFIEKNKK